jgi:hypothetical protein
VAASSSDRESVVRLLRSHLRLTARAGHTPRGRPLRSYDYRQDRQVWQTRRSLHGLLRQVTRVFGSSVLVSASRVLRTVLHKKASALPVNKAFQRDKVAVSQLLHKTQKLRHGNFAPEQRRYATRYEQDS